MPRPFDQQPVEAWAAIDAAAAAYDLTGDAIWLAHAQRAFRWFSGANDRGLAVADPLTGTCRDGINRRGLNLNEGAESVLAYQHACLALRALTRSEEHTSELQSLMRISYAVFCLKKKKTQITNSTKVSTHSS